VAPLLPQAVWEYVDYNNLYKWFLAVNKELEVRSWKREVLLRTIQISILNPEASGPNSNPETSGPSDDYKTEFLNHSIFKSSGPITHSVPLSYSWSTNNSFCIDAATAKASQRSFCGWLLWPLIHWKVTWCWR
jgi:hypothetical protein